MSISQDSDLATRKGRVMAIRDASGLQPKEFAARMAVVAQQLGLASAYSDTKLSKLVNGRQDVSLDDAIVLAHLDPKKRGVEWIALGDTTPATSRTSVPYAQPTKVHRASDGRKGGKRAS